MEFNALVSKMSLLITIVTDGLTQVLIFLTRWPVAATITIVSSRGLHSVALSCRSETLRLPIAGAAIMTIPISLILLVVSARSFGLNGLEVIRRHGSCLVRAEWKTALVPGIIFGRFWGRAMAPRVANIHLADLEKKVQGGFSLSRDDFPNGLISGVFLTNFLLGLSLDRWP